MIIALISVIGTLASLGGIYAIVDNRRNRRVKALGYEDTGPFPLATASRHEQDYELTIHYRAGPAGEDEVIEAAYVTYLRFANFGKEPIRKQDIAPANPLRVQVSGVRVLDISLAGVRREVAQISLGELDLREEKACVALSFDFLDQEDGGLIRILSTDQKDQDIELVGDIIGMPTGVFRTDKPIRASERWGKVGVGLFLAVQVAAMVLAAYVVKLVTGDWMDAWLLLLPIGVIIGPGLLALIVSETVWPNRTKAVQYPQELALPRWLRRSAMLRERVMPYPEFEEGKSEADLITVMPPDQKQEREPPD